MHTQSSNRCRKERQNRSIIGEAVLHHTGKNDRKCCPEFGGWLWRHLTTKGKPQNRCTTTIHRMYKSPNKALENLLPVWHLVHTIVFISIRFRLRIRNLTVSVSATWRNAENSLNRCTSTFSAQNYCTGIFFKSLSYLYEVVRKPLAPIFGLFEILDRNYVKPVAPPRSKKEPSLRKKIWKPRRNRPVNGNAMLVQPMCPSNEQHAGLGAWQKN